MDQTSAISSPDARPIRVFISYSRKDGAFAGKLCAVLIDTGYDAYLDTKDILPGEHWRPRLSEFSRRGVHALLFTPHDKPPIHIVGKKTTADFGAAPVLLVEGATTPDAVAISLRNKGGIWIAPRPSAPADIPLEQAAASCEQVLESWRNRFTFREAILDPAADAQTRGLRRPQVGALHAALAHTTSSTDPATIVMPTGTGKTETMLAFHTSQRIRRLLVIVPTDPLREQISRKFETVGVLQAQECLPSEIQYPVVLRLNHIPKSPAEIDALFVRANVIVTTITIAGRAGPEVQERMAQLADALFIDEAHHIHARTWREFRKWFIEAAGGPKPVYQFTATPFREDGGRVDGRFIYTYPLKKAQDEGYFGKVEFQAVTGMEQGEADEEIARRVSGRHRMRWGQLPFQQERTRPGSAAAGLPEKHGLGNPSCLVD